MNRLLTDFGPRYAETVLGRFPVEPWNTSSNAIFLVIVVLFARRTRLNFRAYPCVLTALPLLLVGFIGGTVFHATRSHWGWLVMDFLPIAILASLGAYFFWRQILGSSFKAAVVLVVGITLTQLARSALRGSTIGAINGGYVLLAMNLLVPAVLCLARNRWERGKLLLAAVVSFACAIVFRMLDPVVSPAVLPMGTHFLWHVCGGLATFCLFQYIFELEHRSAGMVLGINEDARP